MLNRRSTYNPVAEWPFTRREKTNHRRRGTRSRGAMRPSATHSRRQSPARSHEAVRSGQRGDLFAWCKTAVEGSCCWYRCIETGQPYRVSGILVNTVRNYCAQHVYAAECAGLHLTAFEARSAARAIVLKPVHDPANGPDNCAQRDRRQKN